MSDYQIVKCTCWSSAQQRSVTYYEIHVPQNSWFGLRKATTPLFRWGSGPGGPIRRNLTFASVEQAEAYWEEFGRHPAGSAIRKVVEG